MPSSGAEHPANLRWLPSSSVLVYLGHLHTWEMSSIESIDSVSVGILLGAAKGRLMEMLS